MGIDAIKNGRTFIRLNKVGVACEEVAADWHQTQACPFYVTEENGDKITQGACKHPSAPIRNGNKLFKLPACLTNVREEYPAWNKVKKKNDAEPI